MPMPRKQLTVSSAEKLREAINEEDEDSSSGNFDIVMQRVKTTPTVPESNE